MLAKSHSNKSKSTRKAKKTPGTMGMPTLTEKYNKADALVELVYIDIANGVTRSECIKKITLGAYDGMEKPIKARQAANYYNAALDRFAVDTDIEAERLRNLFWGRYETLYADAVKKGDVYNARGVLDSMSKIFLGIDGKNKASIEVKNNNGDVKITFGFDTGEENNNTVDAEIIEDISDSE